MIHKLKYYRIFSLVFICCFLFSCNDKKPADNKVAQPDQNANQNALVIAFPNADIADSVDILYNYSRNKSAYKLSFLEFGAIGCVECKKMESVLKQVKQKYPNSVNVVFYNLRLKQNKKIGEYFGITLIPVQVLLDNSGVEKFRHQGYISFEELDIQINKLLKNH